VLLQPGRAREHDDGGASPKRTRLRVRVARSCKRLRKLCTGRPSAARLRAVLAWAAGETLAAATGEGSRLRTELVE